MTEVLQSGVQSHGGGGGDTAGQPHFAGGCQRDGGVLPQNLGNRCGAHDIEANTGHDGAARVNPEPRAACSRNRAACSRSVQNSAFEVANGKIRIDGQL